MGYVNYKNGEFDVSLTEKGHEFHNFSSENSDRFLKEEEKKKRDELENASKEKDLEIKNLTVKNLRLKNRQLKWAILLSIIGFITITFRKEIYEFLKSFFN